MAQDDPRGQPYALFKGIVDYLYLEQEHYITLYQLGWMGTA
jgi:hypothetical protein